MNKDKLLLTDLEIEKEFRDWQKQEDGNDRSSFGEMVAQAQLDHALKVILGEIDEGFKYHLAKKIMPGANIQMITDFIEELKTYFRQHLQIEPPKSEE